jgi:hypothetical protein
VRLALLARKGRRVNPARLALLALKVSRVQMA